MRATPPAAGAAHRDADDEQAERRAEYIAYSWQKKARRVE